jgi:hypothetical protein
MNTIPLTLDDRKPTYNVLGGGRVKPAGEAFPVSVLLLNRGPRLYRIKLLEELADIGFDSIVSLETLSVSPELEGLSARFPQLRFIVFQEELNIGEQLNVGMRESGAPYVFVLWNDMRLATSALSSRFFDRVVELDAACLLPTLSGADGSLVPSIMNPAAAGQNLRVVPLQPAKDGEKSLFPFDLTGIYSRERFIMSGGFDWTIANPYWQRMDFGMRMWLWGEELLYAQALRLNYQGTLPSFDSTPDEHYGRFWLKNLAPRHKGDSAELPAQRLLPFMLKSSYGPFRAYAEFQAARNWVRVNAYRFKQDARRLIELWDPLA